MSDSDDIVSRADAFMNRQRSASSPADDLDDLPVLTDVVLTPATNPDSPPQQFEQLAHELSEMLRQRLAAEIPALVENALQAALPGISRDIHQSLEQTTQNAIRDSLKALTQQHP